MSSSSDSSSEENINIQHRRVQSNWESIMGIRLVILCWDCDSFAELFTHILHLDSANDNTAVVRSIAVLHQNRISCDVQCYRICACIL